VNPPHIDGLVKHSFATSHPKLKVVLYRGQTVGDTIILQVAAVVDIHPNPFVMQPVCHV
jgi:hypothetical protein